MQTNTKITFAVLGVVALIGMVMVPSGGASNHEEFGTQVQLGDADFIPTIDALWGAFRVNSATAADICVVPFGDGQNVADFGFYLMPDQQTAATQATVQRFALRLVPVMGHDSGTLVLDTHTSEIGQPCSAAAFTARLKYGDVNNNGRYDAGDYVWLTTNPANAPPAVRLDASSGPTLWTIRLTATSGGAAGSIVFAQDADFTAYSGSAVDTLNAMSFVGYFNADRSFRGSGATCPGALPSATGCSFTPGDSLYIVMSEAGVGPGLIQNTPVVGNLVTVHSLRLHGPAGAFGSQVLLDSADFIPMMNEYTAAPAGFISVCVVTFGETTVSSFGFYLNPNAAIGGAVGINYIRLNAVQGNAAGTLTRSSDLQEVGQPCVGSTYSLVYADVNNNGRYDAGDWVFMTSNAAGTAGMVASSGAAAWTLRLTMTGSGAAGSLVFTGDADFISYGAAANSPTYPTAGTAHAAPSPWGVFDRDRSGIANGAALVTPGDSIYLGNAAAALGADSQVPIYSLRVLGDSGGFGSQVVFGDSDFRPILAAFATPAVCVAMFGDGTNISNSGFYLVNGAATAAVPTNAVRLNTAQGNPPGSVVLDSHTTERGFACGPAGGPAGSIPFGATAAASVQVHFTDRNNNGRYDTGDGVYLTTHPTVAPTGLTASVGATQWTLRLTQASTPGSLVFAGDADFITYQNAAPELTAATVNLFDEDLSGAAIPAPAHPYSAGDTVYISPGALGVTPVTPIHSIRVTGSLPVSAPPPPPPTTDDVTTDDVTTDDVTTDDDTTDDTTTDTTTTDTTTTDDVTTDEDEDADTPGPAILLVLAAIGAVIVALRRRK